MPLSPTRFLILWGASLQPFPTYYYPSYGVYLIKQNKFAFHSSGYLASYNCSISVHSNVNIVSLPTQKTIADKATNDVTLISFLD